MFLELGTTIFIKTQQCSKIQKRRPHSNFHAENLSVLLLRKYCFGDFQTQLDDLFKEKGIFEKIFSHLQLSYERKYY